MAIVSIGASLTRCGYAERSLRPFSDLARMHHRLAGALLGAPQATPVVLGHAAPLSRRPQQLGAQGWRAAKENLTPTLKSRPVGPSAAAPVAASPVRRQGHRARRNPRGGRRL